MDKIIKKWFKYWCSISAVFYVLAVLFSGEWIIYNMPIEVRGCLFVLLIVAAVISLFLLILED